MVPTNSRSQSVQLDAAEGRGSRSQAQSGFGLAACHPGPLFRARAKTLASITTSSRSNDTTQVAPQEIRLPRTTRVNGQPIEAYLYKDASECPICFLYYPPYLNKTRCCDQPICSECFVQIKRPDPHPPDHHGAANAPTGAASSDTALPIDQQLPEEQAEQLVSEPSQCPFCVQPEFGVTYEPPPFRSGLVYTGSSPPVAPQSQPGLDAEASAMKSSASLGSTTVPNRRRTTSLSAAAPSVITTDRVRPDWAKKLSDARAHVLRRSAAATALHNAAYVLGSSPTLDLRLQGSGRRRRTLFGDAEAGSTDDQGAGDGADEPGRQSSTQRSRAQDIEDLMMMEAIRLSLAAEEDRKKKEEKESKKQEKQQAKADAKQQAKQAKEARKEAKKASRQGSLYAASANASTSTWASGQGQSSGNAANPQTAVSTTGPTTPLTPNWPLPAPVSKGKGPTTGGAPLEDAQQYLTDSRASIHPPSPPVNSAIAAAMPSSSEPSDRPHQRQFSSTSSIASSMIETPTGSFRNESGHMTPEVGAGDTRSHTPQVEPMLNFQSLAAMIGSDDKNGQSIARVQQVENEDQSGSRPSSSRDQSPGGSSPAGGRTTSRSRGNSEIRSNAT